MTNFYAPDDEDCTIDEVNAALKEAGYNHISIFYDPANADFITISHEVVDINGHTYYQDQRTGRATPYWFAQDFEAGTYRVDA